MRILFLLSVALVLSAGVAVAQPAPAPKTHLKVGDPAPDFTLKATDGSTVTLSSLRGRNSVVLAFFPAAFTGGCTKEMQAYRDGIAKFEASGAKVFGISTDNLPSQRYWATEVLNTPVPILSDFLRGTSEKYGVLNKDRSFANRATFVVDRDGKIAFIEEGSAAVDPASALEACSRPKLSR